MSAVKIPTQLLVAASVAALLAAYVYQRFHGARYSRQQRLRLHGNPFHLPRSRQVLLRVDEVPTSTSAAELESKLQSIIAASPDLQGQLNDLVVLSLASRDRTCACATVAARTLLPENQLLAHLQCASKELPYHFDCTFYGITPLYEDPAGAHCDVIAVPGLASHAVGSWKSPGGNDLWLRDWLPNDIPNIRVLLYGYDTTLLKSNAKSSIEDLGRRFLESLTAFRISDGTERRPIILLGHSLGGLLIKEALVHASRSPASSPTCRLLSRTCCGLLFFGVPQLGLRNEKLAFVVEGQPNQALIRALVVDDESEPSDFLARMADDFARYFQDRLRVVCFYERRQSATVTRQPDGTLRNSGPPVLMVTRKSATSTGLTGVPEEDIVPLDADHSGLVKFTSRWDDEYVVVKERIMSLVADVASWTVDPPMPHQRAPQHAIQLGSAKERIKSLVAGAASWTVDCRGSQLPAQTRRYCADLRFAPAAPSSRHKGRMRAIHAATGECEAIPHSHNGAVRSAAFSANGRRVVVGISSILALLHYLNHSILQPSNLLRRIRRFTRPGVVNGLIRIEWTCSCGADMYGDFTDSDPEAIRCLKGQLFMMSPRCSTLATNINPRDGYTSAMSPRDTVGDFRQRQSTTGVQDMHQAASASETEGSIPGTKQNTGQSLSDTGHHSNLSTAHSGDLMNKLSADEARSSFFYVCVNKYGHDIRLGELPLAGVSTDGELFDQIWAHYCIIRGWSLRRLFRKPTDVHFVLFSVLHRRTVGIHAKPDAIPPEEQVLNRSYHYWQCPLENLPPMPANVFLHYLSCAEHHSWDSREPSAHGESVFFSRLPKKLRGSLFQHRSTQRSPDMLFGWGIHIIEGPNLRAMSFLLFGGTLLSLLVSILVICLAGTQEQGFGIGSWMLALVSEILAVLYFSFQES